MRSILATMVGVAFVFSAACSKTTIGSTSTSGTTTGVPPQGLDAGSPCTSDSQCNSNNCANSDPSGGLCCAGPCNLGTPSDICTVPNGCTDAGACNYPATGFQCGETCAENGTELVTKECINHICAGGPATACNTGYTCFNSQTCYTSCTADGGQCAADYYCVDGACQQQTKFGSCESDDECNSGHCGSNHLCCAVACPPSANDTTDCNAAGCTYDAGACEYPVGHPCIAQGTQHLCVGDNTILGGQCNFTGFCEMDAGPCPDNLACDPKGDSCEGPTCRVTADCATGFYCKGQICVPQQVDGGCSTDDQCVSGHCGVNDTSGHCCPTVGCIPADDGGICGATDCDGTTANCNYAGITVDCGAAESCNPIQEVDSPAAICNGAGICTTPALRPCAPFLCNGSTGCFTACTPASVATECIAGDFCDPAAGQCCAGLAGKNSPIAVDATNGVDAACCGLGGKAKACATITYAMKLIASAQVQNAIITATVKGGGGDWAPAGEVYPIVLGYGVELSAAGVAFLDPTAAGAEIFDIKAYDANDTLGSASIIGGQGQDAIVGYNQASTKQTSDSSSILVEKGATLYLADADVNGNATGKTTAISVQGGGTLWVGKDDPAIGKVLSGTVTVGVKAGAQTDGWNGIVCAAGTSTQPCTIEDPTLVATSSLQIFNQENDDLEADDYAAVTLVSAPTFGLTPGKAGFGQCTTKNDGKGGTGHGILLDGAATVTLENATISCIASPGIYLESTPNGTPTLTLESSKVQNTEQGLYVGDGTATVTGTTFEFNYNGVEQAGSGTVNLNGGATTGNTVICDSSTETANGKVAPGVGVNDANSSGLDASNTQWNTTAPDVFSCTGALATTCTCAIPNCTHGAGKDDMDAVETSTGMINTANGTQSAVAVTNGCNK